MRFFVIAMLLLSIACRRETQAPEPQNLRAKVASRTVKLFFVTPDERLAVEERTVALPEERAAALTPILRELFKGSVSTSVPRLFPPDAGVRGTYILPGGLAVIDLGGATFSDGWNTGSHQEMLAVDSLVRTVLANEPAVRRVRIVVNGQVTETLGGHIDLGHTWSPVREFLAGDSSSR